jgi:hypothetical protein
MQLSEQEQQLLQDNLEFLELEATPTWQKFRKVKIEDAIARIENSLATVPCANYESYLSLWHRRQALLMLLNEFDAMRRETKELNEKAALEPDNSAATGSLS